MNFTEFKNAVADGICSPAYIFEGEDGFFIARGIAELKKKFLIEPELDCAAYDGAVVTESELVSSLECFPFISEKRFTVVTEYYPDEKKIASIKKYLLDPSDRSVLVVLNGKKGCCLGKIKGVATVDCDRESEGVIARIIKGRCENEGVSISLETAKEIAVYCLRDMSRIVNEVEKLVCYCKDKKEITDEDVNLLVAKDTEYKVYEMTDCIGKRRIEDALYIVKELEGKGETPQRLISALYGYFRRLTYISISSESDEELSKLLGIKEYAVKKSRQQAKVFGPRALKRAMDALGNADYDFKSGKVDAEDAMWLSIFKILTEGVK